MNRREKRAQRRARASAFPAPAPEPLAGAHRATAAVAVGVALFALVLYLKTLAPTVTLVDSGELLFAADAPGVAHPPGFPVWIFLAHLATYLPWESVALRIHASSALFAALASGLLVLVVRWAALSSSAREPGSERSWRWSDLLPPALAGLLLATSRTLWSYATLAEVYALNTLLAIGLLALLLVWRRNPKNDRPLLAAAALFGVALGVHHVTIALLLPAFAVLVWRTAGGSFFSGRRVLRAAALALGSAVAVYLYLPWLASRAEPAGLDWGAPSSFSRLIEHVSGRQYRVFLAPTADSIGAEIGSWAAGLNREFGPIWFPLVLLLALLGFRALARSDRTLFATLAALLAVNCCWGFLYTIAEDKDAYYLPTVATLAVASGFGARSLLASLSGRRRALAAILLLLLPMAALFAGWTRNDRSSERVAERFVEDALQPLAQERQALLLTGEWQLYSPWLYLHEVEGRWPKVMAIDALLLRRSWYYGFLERRDPALLAAAGGTVEPFLVDLRRWDREPEIYDRDPTLNRRINDRFHAMLLDLVARGLERGSVYVTRDFAQPPFAADPAFAAKLAAAYQLVPRGLLFELTRNRDFVDPGPFAETNRELFDRARPLDPGSVAALKVRPVYLSMITSRGLYYAAHGRLPEARAALLEALVLDPSYDPARQAFNRLPPI